jgi:hypothetical protein
MSLDRILTELYLPLSVLGAYFFCFVEEKLAGNIKQIRHIIVALLMFSGILTSTFFIESYYKPWGLPQQDYDAFQWLKNQGYEKTIAVNLDSTGMWAYPLARIELVDPFMFTYNPPQYIKDTAYRPNSDTTLEYMRNLSKTSENVLIYISSVSTTRPNYKPPFTRFYGFYLSVNASAFDERYYHRVYDRDGVFIFEYIEGK